MIEQDQSQIQSNTDVPRSRIARPLAFIAAIAVALLLLGGAAYWYLFLSGQTPKDVRQIVMSALGNDADQTVQLASEYVRQNEGSEYAFSASVVLAQSMFEAARTPEALIAAVKEMKANLSRAQTPYQRAVAVNALALAVYTTDSDEVYAEVFREEPLNVLRDTLRKVTSVTNLLTYSINEQPTADAYLMLARQVAEDLIWQLRSGRTQPIDTSEKAGKERVDSVKYIEEYVGLADAAAESQKEIEKQSPYAATLKPGRDLWSGFALGAAARVKPELLPEAEQRLSQAIDAAKSIRDERGDPYPALMRTAARAELTYARLLNAIGRANRSDDTRAHIVAFLAIIQADPVFYRNFFDFFDSAKAGADVEHDKQKNQLYREFREYQLLAHESPELTAFLTSRGWKL